MNRFPVRTVKAGRVRIYGSWFRVPDDPWPSEGRFEGKRLRFGVYPHIDGGIEPCAVLHSALREEDDGLLVQDGYLRWHWWRKEKEVK